MEKKQKLSFIRICRRSASEVHHMNAENDTLQFRRNSYMAIQTAALMAFYFLALLYCISRLLTTDAKPMLIGFAVLLAWAATKIAGEVRRLLYYSARIEIGTDGVKTRKNMIRWEDIREAELRQSVGMWLDRAHPDHVVLSTIHLNESVRKLLCSDVDPWLFNGHLMEFDLGRQKHDAEIRRMLSENCPLFADVLDSWNGKGMSAVSDERTFRLDYYKLFGYCKSAASYSFFRFLESAMWFLAVAVTTLDLSKGQTRFSGLITGIWIVTLALSAALLIWIARKKQCRD